MEEFFFTLFAIWLVWRLFGAFSRASRPKETTQQFHQTNHHHHYHQRGNGDVTIQQNRANRKSKPDSEPEYTDYEDIT